MVIMKKIKQKGIIQVTEIRIEISMVKDDNKIDEIGKNKWSIGEEILTKEKNLLH